MKKPSGDSRPPKLVWITIEDFEEICFNTTQELFDYNEPIPDYSTRDNALLESALGSPQQTFDGNLLYPTLIDQAVILFYSLIKNHPFKNGNKRIAVITLLVFLAFNNKWIAISQDGLYDLALLVSKSEAAEKDLIVKETTRLLAEFIIPFPEEG